MLVSVISSNQVVVLSVDDDPVNQAVIEFLLEGRHNYHVVKAMDGMEALHYLEMTDTLPDLILLDVMMPGLSGYEVCVKIRELYPASIPIIMISAKCGRDDIVQGLNCKCNDYVTKPFDKEELLARIETHIKLNSMRQAQENAQIEDAVRHATMPSAEIPQGTCLVVSAETYPTLLIDTKRDEIELIAKNFDVIIVPSRFPIFHAITQADKIHDFVQQVIDLIESVPENSITFFVSEITDLHSYDFNGLVPSKFIFSPELRDHMRLIAESRDICGLELPSCSRPSSVFSQSASVCLFKFESVKCRKETCRIFFQSKSCKDSVDPLAGERIRLDLAATSGASVSSNLLHLTNPCCKNLNDSMTESESGETGRDFVSEFSDIVKTYTTLNSSEIYASLSDLINDIAAVFRAGRINTTTANIELLIASVDDRSLQESLRNVLISHLRNERLEANISQREHFYSQIVKIVNRNLKNVLEIESLNEMMYLEVQRRVFDTRFTT